MQTIVTFKSDFILLFVKRPYYKLQLFLGLLHQQQAKRFYDINGHTGVEKGTQATHLFGGGAPHGGGRGYVVWHK
jgi:hypothetical protein